jgi:membrane-associated phospholipid phosphatase
MKPFLDWGIEVVVWFQQFGPTLDLPFKSLTFLGNLEFFLVLMPFIYWCVDRRLGARLLVLFLISAYVNAMAKVVADQPRPFQYDARVQPLVHAGGGGMPSGHTQGAVVVWGYLASQIRSGKIWIIAGFLMIAIPIFFGSRQRWRPGWLQKASSGKLQWQSSCRACCFYSAPRGHDTP